MLLIAFAFAVMALVFIAVTTLVLIDGINAPVHPSGTFTLAVNLARGEPIASLAAALVKPKPKPKLPTDVRPGAGRSPIGLTNP